MRIVGIAGRAGSGKDPAARVVAGFTTGPTRILRMATGLKYMLSGLYGITPGSTEYLQYFETNAGKLSASPMPLSIGNSVRDDLIQLGDATRAINLDVWKEDFLRRALVPVFDYIIVPDIRYKNETSVCDQLIWIGPDTPGDHPTEAELSSKDCDVVYNFGSVADNLNRLREELARGQVI